MSDPTVFAETFNTAAKDYEKKTGGATQVVAKHLVALAAPYDSSSAVLDNAAGTGIIVEELFAHLDPTHRDHIRVTAVDAAQGMIDMADAKIKLNNWKNVTTGVMPGENLGALSDETFTHSFTNFGIFFFPDTQKGAAEIFRTLKPGGKAFVTTWKETGWVPVWQKVDHELLVNRRQEGLKVKEEDYEPVKMPFDERWSEASHLEHVMREAGFRDVQTHQVNSWYEGESTETLASNWYGFVKMMNPERYTQQEKDEVLVPLFTEFLDKIVRPSPNGDTVGFTMVANVAVCTK
jgi:ubiquinone/menaquinone biosynthesis C-methylase UbiE